jgi:hypothetical protein
MEMAFRGTKSSRHASWADSKSFMYPDARYLILVISYFAMLIVPLIINIINVNG